MNEQETREYEVAFLVAEEETAGKVITRINQYGTVLAQAQLKRIAFAYPIKKVEAGYFAVVKAAVAPDAVARMEKDLETAKEVLRSLVIRLPREKKDALSSHGEQDKSRRARTSSRSEAPQSRPGVLTNEALEKKIEEILK